MTYALAAAWSITTLPAVRAVVHEAARNHYRLSSLILGIVKVRHSNEAHGPRRPLK